ncbi:MAG: hypothetical protein MJ025_00025 [Victivallaceae bacterium]|nr:hypothetical protein [Victivallaceae bacterium]
MDPSPSFRKLYSHVGEAMAEYAMVSHGDRVMVAMSGGKDSTVMLHALLHFQRVAPVRFDLVAVTFDPGYGSFDSGAIASYCRSLGVEHHVVGMPVGEIIRAKNFEDSPCVLCSRLRRGLLYTKARELGCRSLALGHHLDDIAVSFLMSVCRGHGISTMGACVEPKSPSAVRIIRPLAKVPESLVVACAAEIDVPKAGDCPYHDRLADGDRAYFGRMLRMFAERVPDVRSNMLKSFSRVEPDHLMRPSSNDGL